MSNKNVYMNNYMKTRYSTRRQKAIDYLGGCCSSCGSISDLEFHHADPLEKVFTIARGSSFSEERFWTEVNKCILLCDVCHKSRHAANRHPHGDVCRYWAGCRCVECKRANREHGHNYKLRRKEHLDSDV